MLQARVPPHFRVCRKQNERFVRGDEEAVPNFRTCFFGEIERLMVEVPVGLWTNDIADTHRLPVFFKRSSSRRCLASQ